MPINFRRTLDFGVESFAATLTKPAPTGRTLVVGALALADVGRTVEQLAGMTQRNAALVEETAAAATSLKESAERLSREMAYFRV